MRDNPRGVDGEDGGMRERAGTARGAVRAGWCAGVCRRPAAACATSVAHAAVVGVIRGILSLHIPSLPFGIHYVTLVTPSIRIASRGLRRGIRMERIPVT